MNAYTKLSPAGWIAILFYGTVVLFILNAKIPEPPAFPPVLFQQLLIGKDPFIAFGSEFSVFKPYLPPQERVSFIMDYPFSPYGKDIQQLYTAQSYLAPVILSYNPDQRAAIIFCSNKEIAERRMRETGYSLLVALGDGKGIAAKTA